MQWGASAGEDGEAECARTRELFLTEGSAPTPSGRASAQTVSLRGGEEQTPWSPTLLSQGLNSCFALA